MIETIYLHYFLAIAREQNITRAAESLHISQPTLSKQMMDLEEMLGCQLFIRSKKKTELTEDGMFLRARAQEMSDLMEKLDSGLIDFGLLLSPWMQEKYDYISLNYHDSFGLLMKKDSPLAAMKSIPIKKLYQLPLIMSRQNWSGNHPIDWKGLDYKALNIGISEYIAKNNELLS